VGILGSNRVGKTTLLKIAATFIIPTAGHVTIGGYDVVKQPQQVKSLAAYSFADDRSFYWRLSGRQNLEFCAALDNLHGHASRAAITEVSDRLGLGPYLEAPYSTLSAGFRQRFALARALLRRPRVLLLDEPTRSVDPREARLIWTFLREELVEQLGVTMLLVTHQVDEAVALCDRIMIMEHGRLKRDLRPDDLMRESGGINGLTLTLTGFRASELAKLRALRGVRGASLSYQDGKQQLEVLFEDGNHSVADIVASATGSGANLHSLVEGTPVEAMISRMVNEREEEPVS
jgi:ABC-2 type transport system ATP-binding protein